MDVTAATAVLLMMMAAVGVSLQSACDGQCDCVVSSDTDDVGVHVASASCPDGSITWYNPVGALRLELNPSNVPHFKTCVVIKSGNVKLKLSQEIDVNINSKSPTLRSKYVLNDSNLKTLMTSHGTSPEYCITSREPVVVYIEPERTEHLGYQKIVILYDSTHVMEDPSASMEECRPCSEAEMLKAYCSSDFVVVGSMNSVHHNDELDKTRIDVSVAQMIRQKGSHFARTRRDSPTLDGHIFAPRKCGVVKGEGLFLMTGRVRLGELRIGCAPYLSEWESIVNRAELEGRMECTRD